MHDDYGHQKKIYAQNYQMHVSDLKSLVFAWNSCQMKDFEILNFK